MQQAGLIDTIRQYIYKILYKWGFKIGHLMAKAASWSFIEGIKTAFNSTISSEMAINLAADNFSNVFESIASQAVQDLASEIDDDIDTDWSQGSDFFGEQELAQWQQEALTELRLDRTVSILKTVFSDPNHQMTQVAVSICNGEAAISEILEEITNYNESNSSRALDLLLSARLDSQRPVDDGEIEFMIRDEAGNHIGTIEFELSDDGTTLSKI